MAHTADTPCGAGDPDPLGVESPIVVPPPDTNMSRRTSSRRPLWSRRGERYRDQGGRYRDHQHHRAPDENIRSLRFHSPLRQSKSGPFPKRSRLEDGRKGSSSGGYGYSNRMYESLPLSSWCQCSNISCVSRGRHCYNDEEGSGNRGIYHDGRHTQGDLHSQIPPPSQLA